MFNFFNNSNNSPKDSSEKNLKIEGCRLSTEEMERIQNFELDWNKKIEESQNLKIPCMMKFSEEDMIEDLIKTRCIRFYDDNEDRIKVKKDLTSEMLEIESSLIDTFLLQNTELFIKGNMLSKFLSENELNQKFLGGFDDSLSLHGDCDFISTDKKIISIEKNLYFLDWNLKEYSGSDKISFKWELDGRQTFGNEDQFDFQLFWFFDKTTYEGEIDSKKLYDLLKTQPLMKFCLFNPQWVNDTVFMNCLNSILSFNFNEKLKGRTKEFYQVFLNQEDSDKKEEQNKVQSKLSEFVKTIDSDGNKIVDITEENGFKILFDTYRDELGGKDQKTIQNLVKLKLFIEDKGENINKLFRLFETVENENEMEHYVGVLNNELNLYQKFCFHSMSLITFLVEGDMFSFYEVYEVFDDLNVFNSKWEKDLSSKLDSIKDEIRVTNSNLEKGFKELSDNIYSNTLQTQKSLEKLTYTTKESISSLTRKMDIRLQSVKSSIDTNNLLTLINTYQVYKINKNTKTLKP
jgi:hypothetical protein